MDESKEIERIAAALSQDGGHGTAPERIARSLMMSWQAIDAALAPIVGANGVAALYRRSLHVSARSWPWLAGALEGPADRNVELLQAILGQQAAADAALGAAHFLHTFHALLASLIGPSLTEKLLRSIWIRFLTVAPSQDPLS